MAIFKKENGKRLWTIVGLWWGCEVLLGLKGKKSLDYCGFVVGLWSVAGFESEKEFGLLLGLCYLWLIGLLIVLHSLQPMHHRMLYGLWSYPSCQFYMKIREKKKLKKEEENNYVWWMLVSVR